MMGLFAGLLLVAAAAWLYTLTQQMYNQSLTLGNLEKTVEQTDEFQKIALETLLANTVEGREPKKFVETYRKALKELEESKEATKGKELAARLLTAENGRIMAELDKVSKAKDDADEKVKMDKEDILALRDKVKDREAELDGIRNTPEAVLTWKYSTSLYAAIAGWIVAILASLGLVAMWLTRVPIDDGPQMTPSTVTVPVPGVSPSPPPSEEPPHQIV